MNTRIKLNTDLVNNARIHAKMRNRSTSKQIEHWAIIGRIAKENPNLNYTQLKKILSDLPENKNR